MLCRSVQREFNDSEATHHHLFHGKVLFFQFDSLCPLFLKTPNCLLKSIKIYTIIFSMGLSRDNNVRWTQMGWKIELFYLLNWLKSHYFTLSRIFLAFFFKGKIGKNLFVCPIWFCLTKRLSVFVSAQTEIFEGVYDEKQTMKSQSYNQIRPFFPFFKKEEFKFSEATHLNLLFIFCFICRGGPRPSTRLDKENLPQPH